MQVRKYAAEQDAISAEAKALVKRSRQKEAANTKLWEEVHKAAQVRSGHGSCHMPPADTDGC